MGSERKNSKQEKASKKDEDCSCAFCRLRGLPQGRLFDGQQQNPHAKLCAVRLPQLQRQKLQPVRGEKLQLTLDLLLDLQQLDLQQLDLPLDLQQLDLQQRDLPLDLQQLDLQQLDLQQLDLPLHLQQLDLQQLHLQQLDLQQLHLQQLHLQQLDLLLDLQQLQRQRLVLHLPQPQPQPQLHLPGEKLLQPWQGTGLQLSATALHLSVMKERTELALPLCLLLHFSCLQSLPAFCSMLA